MGRMAKPIPLPVASASAALLECTQCAKCCTYVAVPIPGPDKAKEATDMLWFLYHDNVILYRDADLEWCVVFETRCRNLRGDKLCGIYEQRPHVCRHFDNTSCDVNSPEGGLELRTPAEYLDWLAKEKPKVYRVLAESYVPDSLLAGRPADAARRARAGKGRR
jgi:Fe-S-cluster containining protein